MERLTEKITNKNIKETLAYRVKCRKDLEAIQKLGELEDLEEQGKLLKLPYKVGDTLYFPYIDSVTKEKVISKEKVTEIGLYYRVGNGELNSCSEIGNIIFVDESEAESALKEMGENKHYTNRFQEIIDKCCCEIGHFDVIKKTEGE